MGYVGLARIAASPSVQAHKVAISLHLIGVRVRAGLRVQAHLSTWHTASTVHSLHVPPHQFYPHVPNSHKRLLSL